MLKILYHKIRAQCIKNAQRSIYSHFWRKHPALLNGIVLFLGVLFAIETPWALLALLLLFYTIDKKRVVSASFIFFLPLFYFYHVYYFPKAQTEVSGAFKIHTVREAEGFTKGWLYRGQMKTDQGKFQCQIHSPKRYDADFLYTIPGKVHKRGRFYTIKTKEEWKVVEKRPTFVEWRFSMQQKVKAYICSHIQEKRASHFLTGVLTGYMQEALLLKEFAELGLSHILAISGFHFAIIVFVFQFFFLSFFPGKVQAATLICIVTLYMLFIGHAPSVERAWVMSTVVFLGALFERRSFSLNTLGIAALFILIIDPLTATTLGFQLSFLATGGILLLYPLFNKLLSLWFPKYPLQVVIQKSLLWQHGYVVTHFLREILALTCSVHVILLPLLLFVFQSFPLNSLIYNLFFPFLATLSIVLFLLAVVLGNWLHTLNGHYTEWILSIAESPPISFHTLEIRYFPAPLLVCLLMFFFFLGIHFNSKCIDSK